MATEPTDGSPITDKETEATLHFHTESGRNQSNRLMQECFVGLSGLLHGTYMQIDGKQYKIKVLTHEGKLMFDIMDLPGFDHVEFVIEKTGWGRGV